MLNFFKNKILLFLEKTSYKTRRMADISQKRAQINRVLNMSEEEFLLDYEDAMAKYEHAKLFFGIPVFVLFLTTLWGVFKIIAKVLNLQAESISIGSHLETMQTVTLAVLILLTIIVSILFLAASNHIYMLSKNKIFYEEMKRKRKGKKQK